jgi:hypothetical protein
MDTDAARDELFAYTISRGDAAFVHQHALDAVVAATAEANTPPQRLIFALVGLALHVDRGWSGRAVQQAHARLAAKRPMWPAVAIPVRPGSVTIDDVLAAPAGDSRDARITEWCAAEWARYAANHAVVAAFLERHGEQG